MPFAGVTAGTIQYNGYTPPGNIRTSITATPKYDRSGRTVACVVYRLDAVWIVQDATNGTDLAIEDLRRRLQSPGQRLTYSLHGFGSEDVNVGSPNDVMWGPKCVSLTLTPIGSRLAWEVRWVVEWARPECTAARFNGVMEFNYTAAQSIDEHGYSTITIEGELVIAMSRSAGGRQVPDTADNYVDQINLPTPAGFRAVRRNRRISDDRRTVAFEVVFDELRGHGLPYFTTRATGRHVNRSSTHEGQAFISTISVDYTVFRKAQKSKAWLNFFELLKDRLGPLVKKNNAQNVLYDISFEEGLYEAGDELRFEVAYLVTVDLTKIVSETGMWRPVPNTNWQQWRQSINAADDFRGMAGIKFPADVIVDLCGAPVSTGGVSTLNTQGHELASTQKSELRTTGYVTWRNEVQSEPITGRAVMKTLPINQNSLRTGGSELTTGGGSFTGEKDKSLGPFLSSSAFTAGSAQIVDINDFPGLAEMAKKNKDFINRPRPIYVPFGTGLAPAANVLVGWKFPTKGGPPADISGAAAPTRTGDVIQQRVAPTYKIRQKGYAVAAGIRIPCPSIASYAGLPVTPDERRPLFVEKTIGQFAGVPLFMSYWDLPYTVLT